MIQNLFVYGTLMRRAAAARMGVAERQRLEVEGEWLGEGQITGRLYNLGQYPVLAAPKYPYEAVQGEVFWLRAPQATFRWLDLYEGIPPGKVQGEEYRRVVRRVRVARGNAMDACVYILAKDDASGIPTFDERWLAR